MASANLNVNSGPNVFKNLGQRLFDNHPEVFTMLESEVDAFLEQERQYAVFLRPSHNNKERKTRKKEDARRYSHKAATHFEATFVSACSCSGQYRDRRDEDEELSPKKRRITGQGSSSYKVGCKAKICIKVNAPLSTAAISSSSTDSASLPSTGPSIAVGI
ncbi:unnamed protein product, partial [Tilletia controversa]